MLNLILRTGMAFMLLWSGLDARAQAPDADPHYSAAGFFDIHVCDWPEKPPFFFILFSSKRFEEIARIEVFTPDNRLMGELSLNDYRTILLAGKPFKKVFIQHIPTQADSQDGWYSARVTLKDGKQFLARDYVQVQALKRVNHFEPGDGADNVALPTELKWQAVAGARHYQVFISDSWADGKQIYASDVLNEPRLALPKGLLQPDGLYAWRVHARDVNEDVRLGDFNSGSLSREAKFSTAAGGE